MAARNTTQTHIVTVGDTLSPLGAQLRRGGSNITATAGRIKFLMRSNDGSTVIAATTSGISIVDSTAGKVQFDFPSSSVSSTGTYWGWFQDVSGGETDHFPHDGRRLKIRVVGLD